MEQDVLETRRFGCLFFPVRELFINAPYSVHDFITLRLLLEYSRLMSLDREGMTYRPHES